MLGDFDLLCSKVCADKNVTIAPPHLTPIHAQHNMMSMCKKSAFCGMVKLLPAKTCHPTCVTQAILPTATGWFMSGFHFAAMVILHEKNSKASFFTTQKYWSHSWWFWGFMIAWPTLVQIRKFAAPFKRLWLIGPAWSDAENLPLSKHYTKTTSQQAPKIASHNAG